MLFCFFPADESYLFYLRLGKCQFSSSPQSHRGLWSHLLFTAVGLQKLPNGLWFAL